MSKPEMIFKAGAVRASVFVNSFQRNGQEVPIRKVVIEVRYRDKSGEWQGTNSLSLNEVPKAITALQHAYEYLLDKGSSDYPEQSNEQVAAVTAGRGTESSGSWTPTSRAGDGWRGGVR